MAKLDAPRASKRKARSKATGKSKSVAASQPREWPQRVAQESDALDLRKGVFSLSSPKKIAASLKRSAQASKRRKSDPYRSALSMLTFYINRAGKNLPARRKKTLMQAKQELREQFGRATSWTSAARIRP